MSRRRSARRNYPNPTFAPIEVWHEVGAAGEPAAGGGRFEPSAAQRKRRGASGRPPHGEGRNRTGDTTVFSRVLYQLSYLALAAKCSRASV